MHGLSIVLVVFAITFVVAVMIVAQLSPHAPGALAELVPPRRVNAAVFAWVVAGGLVLPVLLFGAVDHAGASSECYLWRLLGERVVIPETQASEPAREGRFILRPYAAHSSHAHIAVACFIFAKGHLGDRAHSAVRGAWASWLFGASMLALGLASYAWWGARRKRALRADHVMMEAHALAATVLFLSIAHPSVRTLTIMIVAPERRLMR
jgi:hypothetical protein